MTSQEQLDEWVAGRPKHRGAKSDPRSECTPDFSCCKPDLLQPIEIRKAFVAASEQGRMKMLGHFLSAAIAKYSKKRVHIAGRDNE
jgi:hypothetical protein